jgi:quercetin dioxygenase-like cupin family protein
MENEISLAGWDIKKFDDAEWGPWGSGDNARAKILGVADGFFVALVEAQSGYRGDPHVHAFPEFLYVLDGKLRNQGQEMTTGDGYAAAPGSTHTDFETEGGATYLSIFKV